MSISTRLLSVKKLFSSSIKKPLTMFVMLFCVSMFTLQSSAVNELMIRTEYTVIADIYYSVFPYLQDENLIRESNYVSKDISTKWAMYAEILDDVLLAFLLIPLSFFAIQLLISVMITGKSEVNTSSRFIALSIVLYLVSPMSSFEIKTATNQVHEVKPLRYLQQSILGKGIHDIEKLVQVNNDQNISLYSVQLGEPQALMNDFKVVAGAFIKNIENSTTDLNTTLNVEFKDGKYIVHYEMGGEEIIITLLSNQSLNTKSARFNIDLVKKEKEMIQDYFNALFLHAMKLNKNISSIEIAINDLKSSNFTDFDNIYFKDSMFEKDYKEYCDNIYEFDLTGADLGVVNTYIEVASQCASHNFLVKHYENPNFDADIILSGQGELKHRNTMLFGSRTFNLTFDNLKSETLSLCESSAYFACAEAIQVLARENIDNGFNLGLLATPVHIINKLLSSFIDISGDIMKNRVVSQTSIQGFSYKDRILDKDADFTVKFIRDVENYNFEIVSPINFIDISKLPEPSISTILDTIAGSSLNSVFQRTKTCFNHSDQIVHGLKCNSATKELTDLGTGFLQWSASLKSGSMLLAFNSKNQKGKALEMGAKGLSKYGSSIGTISALFTPVAFDNYFKSSPYFSAEGAQGLIATSLILEYFGLEVIKYLDSLANTLFVLAFLIYFIVFAVPLRFFLAFLMKIYGTMLSVLIVLNRAYINGYSKGVKGLEELYDEFIIDIAHILLLGVISLLIMSQLEIALIVIFDFISDYIIAIGETITSQILNLPALLVVFISLFIVMYNLPSILLDKVESQYNQLLQESKK